MHRDGNSCTTRSIRLPWRGTRANREHITLEGFSPSSAGDRRYAGHRLLAARSPRVGRLAAASQGCRPAARPPTCRAVVCGRVGSSPSRAAAQGDAGPKDAAAGAIFREEASRGQRASSRRAAQMQVAAESAAVRYHAWSTAAYGLGFGRRCRRRGGAASRAAGREGQVRRAACSALETAFGDLVGRSRGCGDRFQEGLVTGAAASSASASGRFDVGAISVVEVEELVRRPVSTRW